MIHLLFLDIQNGSENGYRAKRRAPKTCSRHLISVLSMVSTAESETLSVISFSVFGSPRWDRGRKEYPITYTNTNKQQQMYDHA